jgi:branched-chain amino acid transport system substrate-binding protein
MSAGSRIRRTEFGNGTRPADQNRSKTKFRTKIQKLGEGYRDQIGVVAAGVGCRCSDDTGRASGSGAADRSDPAAGPAAPVGLDQQQGVQFAVDKINAAGGIRGHKVNVLYEDSQAKPDVGVLSFNKLVDLRNVPAIISAFSSVSLAIAPLATRRKVLVVNAGAQSNQLGNASPYLFNTIPLVKDETSVLVRYIVEKLGKKTAAIIYENAAAGIDGKEDFKKAFEGMGGKIVAEETTEFGQTNYRPGLLKVASVKPDFMYLVMTQDLRPFVDQVSQIQNLPMGIGTTFMRTAFGYPASVGWVQSAIKSDFAPDLEKEFKEKYKTTEAPFFSREYYNAANVVFKAMDRLLEKNVPITGESLRSAIFEVKNFGTSVANVTFADSNTAVRGVEIYQYTKDERKVVAVEQQR